MSLKKYSLNTCIPSWETICSAASSHPLLGHFWTPTEVVMHGRSTIRAPVFGRYQNSVPPCITEKPMEVHNLDECFVITGMVLAYYFRQYSNVQVCSSLQFCWRKFESHLLHCSKCRILVPLLYNDNLDPGLGFQFTKHYSHITFDLLSIPWPPLTYAFCADPWLSGGIPVALMWFKIRVALM